MGLFETTLIGLWSLYLRGKQLTSPEGPGVCIRFAPAESPCLTQTRPLQVENRGFRAGVRANQATMRERKTRSSAVTTSAAPRATDVKSCICGRVNPKRHRTSSVTAMPEHCRWPGTIPPSGSAHGPRHRPPWWPRRRLGRCRRPLTACRDQATGGPCCRTDRQRFAHSPCPATSTEPARCTFHYRCLRLKSLHSRPLDDPRSPSPVPFDPHSSRRRATV